jgi:AraC family transcriptional regulator, alkane utilization regulator
MDALSDVLKIANLTGGVFLRSEFTAPWCVSSYLAPEMARSLFGDVSHVMPFHFVVEGNLSIRLDGEPARHLSGGDLVLIPRNDRHLLGSDLDAPAVPAQDIVQPCADGGLMSIQYGGGGAPTRIVCGYLGCDCAEGNPVFLALPRILTLSVEETGSAEWIRSTFQYAAQELAQGRPGSATVLGKLSELLFVEAVRRYVQNLNEEETGWLAGLRDPVVSRALTLMHSDIARDWSVDELGREAGISRSALADRFVRVIGVAPIQYLARWRMYVAAQKLRSDGIPLGQVAEAVGYASEAAFSRAFKKTFGSAPAAWRKAGVQTLASALTAQALPPT